MLLFFLDLNIEEGLSLSKIIFYSYTKEISTLLDLILMVENSKIKKEIKLKIHDKKLHYKGLYSQPDETLTDDIPYRPIAGVKDISVEYKGGGMKLGATRTATINWTCWTWEELDRLMPHFLSVGKTVLLEWGWVFNENTI